MVSIAKEARTPLSRKSPEDDPLALLARQLYVLIIDQAERACAHLPPQYAISSPDTIAIFKAYAP